MKELLIRAKIDEIEDELVKRAEQVVERFRPDITEKLEVKQLRNVEAVAAETESLAVVDNFIKYQIGRADKPDKGWRWGEQQGKGFGEAVRDDLKELKKRAESNAGDKVSPKDLEIRLVRLYLGYLTRHFTYAETMDKAKKKGGQG